MPDKIDAIEKEIQKIEDQMFNLKKEKPGSKHDKKIREATLSLLRNIIKDLRKQQRKLK